MGHESGMGAGTTFDRPTGRKPDVQYRLCGQCAALTANVTFRTSGEAVVKDASGLGFTSIIPFQHEGPHYLTQIFKFHTIKVR